MTSMAASARDATQRYARLSGTTQRVQRIAAAGGSALPAALDTSHCLALLAQLQQQQQQTQHSSHFCTNDTADAVQADDMQRDADAAATRACKQRNAAAAAAANTTPSAAATTAQALLYAHGLPTPARVASAFAAAGAHSPLGALLQQFALAVVRLHTHGAAACADEASKLDDQLHAGLCSRHGDGGGALTPYLYELQGLSTLYSFLWSQCALAECGCGRHNNNNNNNSSDAVDADKVLPQLVSATQRTRSHDTRHATTSHADGAAVVTAAAHSAGDSRDGSIDDDDEARRRRQHTDSVSKQRTCRRRNSSSGSATQLARRRSRSIALRCVDWSSLRDDVVTAAASSPAMTRQQQQQQQHSSSLQPPPRKLAVHAHALSVVARASTRGSDVVGVSSSNNNNNSDVRMPLLLLPCAVTRGRVEPLPRDDTERRDRTDASSLSLPLPLTVTVSPPRSVDDMERRERERALRRQLGVTRVRDFAEQRDLTEYARVLHDALDHDGDDDDDVR